MIRTLLATTALATLLSTGAFAQTTPAPAPEAAPVTAPATGSMARADGHLATDIIGENVYDGTGDQAQNIGDVNDIVIGANGAIEAVIVGVGGFLGIGEKNVAIDFKTLDWASKDGDRWLVSPVTKEQLEAQAAFDPAPYEVAPAATTAATDPAANPMTPAEAPVAAAPAAPAADQAAQAPATDTTAPAAAAPDATQTTAIDRSTLTEMPAADIRAEDLVGTTVYGAEDANVGEIGDVLLTADGKIDAYVIDVGGFLGMGEKEVAVGSDNLSFMTDKDGNKYLYTSFTKEQLEAQAAYDEGTYGQQRDQQRLMVQ